MPSAEAALEYVSTRERSVIGKGTTLTAALLVTLAGCGPTIATAPRIQPDVVRGCTPHHTFAFDGPVADHRRCGTTATGLHRFCIDMLSSRFRDALGTTLSGYLVPTTGSADYIVAFPVETFDLVYSADDNSFSLAWTLAMRDRSGRVVVSLQGRTPGPPDVSVFDPQAIERALGSIMRETLSRIRAELNGSVLATDAPDCSSSAPR